MNARGGEEVAYHDREVLMNQLGSSCGSSE